MLQSFSQSQDWFYSEPLLFDDEFCQSLMKDLQSLPTPPQSPPMKTGLASKPLSKEDQLSYVSEILLEDQDLQLNWNCDFFDNGNASGTEDKQQQRVEEPEDCLWHCLGDTKSLEEKLSSVLSSSPLLSDIDTSIFEEIAGSTLDCHGAALACQALESEDLLVDSQEQSEATSGYGSGGGEFSTYSSSDSEEEIDVVTVRLRSSSPPPLSQSADERLRLEQQRHHLEIQLQHNYAAPCPASPLRAESSSASSSSAAQRKRSRGSSSSSSSHRHNRHSGRSSSRHRRHHHRNRHNNNRHHDGHHHGGSAAASRHSTDVEDEEERRRTHNVMERQRRNELKNCFLRLRDNVPELSQNDKASKVVILKRARDGIRSLEVEGRRLQARKDKLRERQDRLKAQLEMLRR